MKKILIVDDNEQFAMGLTELLRLHGHDVKSVSDLRSARIALREASPNLLLLDLMLPDGSGLELLEELRERQPDRIALVTGHTAVKSFVHSVAGPGIMYLTKPIESKTVLSILDSISEPEDESGINLHFGLLVGNSAPMQEVYEQIVRVASSDSTVFIQGDSGTGKELVAEALHRQSGRNGAFVPVNCGGLSPELVASELFGHEKGSFTGAGRRHVGFFERAGGGTLFLDEITEMPVEMQTQLLRVLETNRFSRVGGEAEVSCDCRLIAATNRDPGAAVKEGRLREDLYFRLQVFPITLPRLCTRLDDIDELVAYFLRQLNQYNGTNKLLSDDFIARIREHSWPGNVRELKHIVHRAYIMSANDILEAPKRFDAPLLINNLTKVGKSIQDVEKELILSTLEHFDGDKNAAAVTLGVSLKTLYNRLKAYDLNT